MLNKTTVWFYYEVYFISTVNLGFFSLYVKNRTFTHFEKARSLERERGSLIASWVEISVRVFLSLENSLLKCKQMSAFVNTK